jgi:CRP-like cAMP-binding protein
LAIVGLKRIEDRLSALLYLLKQNLGKKDNEKIRLCCRFTHQNLADTIGSTRVTITRLMKDFQTQGWLSVDENRHLLIDPHYQPEQLL